MGQFAGISEVHSRRRGQKDRITWGRMTQLVDAWLPKPIILHPWPSDQLLGDRLSGEPAIRCAKSAAAFKGLVGFLSELHALGIDLFLHQQGLDATTPAGKAKFQMMGVFAEFERAMIQERVRAGLARARSEGKRLGCPPIPAKTEAAIRAARPSQVVLGCARLPRGSGVILARCSG
jgi:Resolvase, N terminal domain